MKAEPIIVGERCRCFQEIFNEHPGQPQSMPNEQRGRDARCLQKRCSGHPIFNEVIDQLPNQQRGDLRVWAVHSLSSLAGSGANCQLKWRCMQLAR